MIKIIKHGKIKVDYTSTCSKCGCEFSYQKEDIQLKSNYSLTSITVPYQVIYCPECGTEIIVGCGDPNIYPYNPLTPTYPYIPAYPYPYPNNQGIWVSTTGTCNCECKEKKDEV